MRILGISKGCTLGGKLLSNGGAAVYVDGKVVALSEDRASGRKYAEGYDQSLDRLLTHTGIDLENDFDVVSVSTCCERESDALLGHRLEGHAKLQSVNHHLSHASLAFYASGYGRSLVV